MGLQLTEVYIYDILTSEKELKEVCMVSKELDKEKIAMLLDTLRGNLSIQKFSHEAGMAAISISKIKAGAYTPSVSTIKKICCASRHPNKEELFLEFMSLAGHEMPEKVSLEDDGCVCGEQEENLECFREHEIKGTKLEELIKAKYKRTRISISAKQDLDKMDEERQKLIRDEFMVLGVLRSRLEDQGYSVEQYIDTKDIHDVACAGRMKIDGGKTEYWFHVVPPQPLPLMSDEAIFGRMSMLQPKANHKISLVVYDQTTFDRILQKAPIGLRMNVSLVYMDLKSFPIEMYENVLTLYNEADEDIMLRLAEEKLN